MAKLALINRENKRRKTVEQFAAKRAALQAIIDDQSKSEDERFAARLKLQRLPRNSSSSRAQPVPDHRSPARRLQQVRPRPQQAPRDRHARRYPGSCQGQLVRGGEREHE